MPAALDLVILIPPLCDQTEFRNTLFNAGQASFNHRESRKDDRGAHRSVQRITAIREPPAYRCVMSHTHSCNLVHCVFSTKDRANFIPDPARLWLYVGGIAGQKNILLWAAGGTTNHLHLLISLPPTLQLAKASKWINELGWRFAWQEGYSAFSVSQSQRRRVIDYIDGQEQHDKKWSFEQEFLALLKKSEIAYDERYVFG